MERHVIRTISQELKQTYGQKIYRLSLSSGCTCPNRDGKVGTGGCSFCSEGGSGDFAAPLRSLEEQIRLAREKVDRKISSRIPPKERRYIAYFQSFTNTYARDASELARLEQLYIEAICRPEIVILSLATRPDCLDAQVMEMLRRVHEAAPGKPIWIELGLQTARDDIAESFRRGYPRRVFEDAYRRLKETGYIQVIVHVILGLPGEMREDMLGTVRYLSDLSPTLDGIKLQLLHVLRHTDLARRFETEPFPVMEMEEYCDLVAECLALLPEDTVVHRMTGDGPKSLLIAPLWSGDKKRVLNTLHKTLRERGITEEI